MTSARAEPPAADIPVPIDRVVSLAVAIGVLVLVAVLHERAPALAAVTATMPLTAPLAMWIVFSSTGGDHQRTADFVWAMVLGFAAAGLFILTCWIGLRQRWAFPLVLAVAAGVWLAAAAGPAVVGRWLN